MPTEVFISRPVHDQLIENYQGLMQEIFAENPNHFWTLAGVRVILSPSLHRAYISALNGLIILLSTKVKNYEFSGQV